MAEPNVSRSSDMRPAVAEKIEEPQPKDAKWLYLWLGVLVAVFAVSNSGTVFLFVSNTVFSLDSKPPQPNFVVVFGMLICMSAQWRAILKREPETNGLFRKKHRRITCLAGIALVILFSAAGLWGYKNGNDRTKTQMIEVFMGDMATAGRAATRVEEIRGRELRTTQDYIDAYGELEDPLKDWRASIQKASAELENIRIFGFTGKAMLSINAVGEALDLAKQRIEVIEKQVAVTREMAGLSNEAQADFWKENLKPLLDEDDNLMAKGVELKGKLKQLGGHE